MKNQTGRDLMVYYFIGQQRVFVGEAMAWQSRRFSTGCGYGRIRVVGMDLHHLGRWVAQTAVELDHEQEVLGMLRRR